MDVQKELIPDDVDYVIYHSPCVDGCTSALIAREYLKEKFPDRDVLFHAASIGSFPPMNIGDRNVLMCDFTYPKHILTEVLKKVNKIMILDHHKTSEKDLVDLPNHIKHFDMNKSGASLTWSYFHPDVEPPILIKYVEDRDLWRNSMVMYEEFASWFYSLIVDMDEYKPYFHNNDLLMEGIKTKGPIYMEHNRNLVRQLSQYAVVKFIKIRDYTKKEKYYFVVYLNSPILKSELGNHLITTYPFADFAAIYNVGDYNNTTSFSLRSTNTNCDVSEVARGFGGGGHRNASGVGIQGICNTLPGIVYDSGTMYNKLNNVYHEERTINGTIYNVVYVYCSNHGSKLARYLLQVKYYDETNKRNVQNADHILSNGDDKEYTNKEYKIAVSLSHNPFSDRTTFNVIIHNSIDYVEVDMIKILLGLNDKGKVKHDGFHKQIPL